MKIWYLLAVVIVVGAAGLFAVNSSASSFSAAQQSCAVWGNETADRVAVARQLLYPRERQEQSTGSIQGDAQALFQLAQEQANSLAPEEGFNLSGDLVEAFSAGANALAGDPSGEAQIAFAKGIVYNADLRLAYLLDGC
jgi:hypothetical protein